MRQIQLREEVSKIILRADNRFLKMVQALALVYSNKKIVAYSANGLPLSIEDYERELSEAEADIKSGRVYSTEEVKKQVRSWKKH